MLKEAIALVASVLAIPSYIGAINSSKNAYLEDVQQAQLQCRTAVDKIDRKLSNPAGTNLSASEVEFLQNQRARFREAIGVYMGKSAHLMYGKSFYLTPAEVEKDRQTAKHRACIA